jgi:hypothetical protein
MNNASFCLLSRSSKHPTANVAPPTSNLLRGPRDGRRRDASSPSPLNGERIRRTSSRHDPLNPVGTRSTASPTSALESGTQWNASLPVSAGRFMERAGVRGEKVENPPISAANLPDDRPHLTLPSPLPPGAEREDPGPLSGQGAATYATTRPNVSPSPLNGERAGVRGEKVENPPISAANLPADRPHLTLPSPLPPGAEREDGRALVVHPAVCSGSAGRSHGRRSRGVPPSCGG